MIFLRRYRVYCSSVKGNGIRVCDNPCGILCTKNPNVLYNNGIKYMMAIKYNTRKYEITIFFNTPNTITFRVVMYGLCRERIYIDESYHHLHGYNRKIRNWIDVDGLLPIYSERVQNVKCSGDMPKKLRELYYDLLKGQFICRILN